MRKEKKKKQIYSLFYNAYLSLLRTPFSYPLPSHPEIIGLHSRQETNQVTQT